jgi:hypothetical protein
MANKFVPNATSKFRNSTITINRMKTPCFKQDENGIPLPTGYLCFTVDQGDNSFVEYYTTSTNKVLQEVVNKKLYDAKYVNISIKFDENGKAIDLDVKPNIPKETAYGFALSTEQKREIEAELLELGTALPASKDNVEDCLIKILKSPNKDGMFAELKFVPKTASTKNVAEILKHVSEAAEQKKQLQVRDLIAGKYIISSVNNDGEYIYVSPIQL